MISPISSPTSEPNFSFLPPFNSSPRETTAPIDKSFFNSHSPIFSISLPPTPPAAVICQLMNQSLNNSPFTSSSPIVNFDPLDVINTSEKPLDNMKKENTSSLSALSSAIAIPKMINPIQLVTSSPLFSPVCIDLPEIDFSTIDTDPLFEELTSLDKRILSITEMFSPAAKPQLVPKTPSVSNAIQPILNSNSAIKSLSVSIPEETIENAIKTKGLKRKNKSRNGLQKKQKSNIDMEFTARELPNFKNDLFTLIKV